MRIKESIKQKIFTSNVAISLILILIYLLFCFIAPSSFSSVRNLETIARQTSIVGMLALGMTVVIILGGIDLSVGSILALATVVIALALNANLSPVTSVFLAVTISCLVGALNSVLITFFRLSSFIVTLGSMLLIRGIAKGISGEQKVDAPLTYLNEILATLRPDDRWMLLPAGVWLTLFLAILLGLFLKKTRAGLYIFAVGSNEKTATMCGVPVNKIKFLAYCLSGFFAGMAGLLQFSRLTVGDPTIAVGIELEAIAAVVIGGASLTGGEGSVFGSVVGALLMSVIKSGCSQMGMPNWIQEIVTGLIIISAVLVDRFRHK